MKTASILLAVAGTCLATLAFAADPAAPAAPAAPSAPSAETPQVGATMKEHVLVNQKELKWVEGPASLPKGAMMAVVEGDPKAPNALFTIRVKLPANYKVMPHSHPADEHITVISGTFNMGMGETFDMKKATALTAGGFGVMPVGHKHFAFSKGETVIQLHGVGPWAINYVNPSDDPRNMAKTN